MVFWQEMNNISSATEYYKEVLKQDNTHVEAIACIGSNHFYTDQPEIALRFYRSDKSFCTFSVMCCYSLCDEILYTVCDLICFTLC